MLVYFVNHSTAPVNLGGAERSMIALVEDWYATDPDFEAVFITKAPRGRFIDAVEQRGWAYRAFPYRGWTIPKADPPASEITYFAKHDFESTLAVIDMMKERRPDLVVTNTVVAPWGAFAAAALGIPHAWFVREYGDLDHGLTFQTGRRATFEDIGLLSQAVFTNSFALKQHAAQYIDDDLISVVYPKVDVADVDRKLEARPETDPFPQADPGLRLTVVGRLSDTKGQWRVVDAIAELAERGIAASACFVGSHEVDDYEGRLLARARERGIAERIVFTGETANPYPYIRAADVCVTPSGFEAFGRTTLEYMLSGRPVLASDNGGSSELVVPGETGWLFSTEVPGELSDALVRYAESPGLAEEHGRAGRERALAIAESPLGNAAAIERLKETAGKEPYRLPNAAQYWFSLPGHYFRMGAQAPHITVAFIATRVRGRLAALGGRVRRRLRAVAGR